MPAAGLILALANQKGGVGKTTTAVNLAACLAEAGERTLVVDLDPQANASSGLGVRVNEATSDELFAGASTAELARETVVPKLELVPARPELAAAAVDLPPDGGGTLARSVAEAAERYSFVFLDCPPSLGPLTVNGLAAADRVLVPVQCEYYALEGLAQLLSSIERIRLRLNPRLSLAGILLTMAARTRLSTEVEREVRRHFGDLALSAVVPRSVRLAEAPSHGLPITLYDRTSAGADAYYRVAGELVDRLRRKALAA